MRRTALALALSAAIVVPAVSATAPAFAAGGKAGIHHAPSKPAKLAFAAAGTITAVDTTAGTVTVTAANGRTKDVRGKAVTVAVGPATVIRVGSARKALTDLAAGYRIVVIGYHQGTAYTATRIDAKKTASKTPPDDAAPVPSSSESRGS